MAEPPGTVVWSFKPVGELQRHQLKVRTRFRCVHCKQQKAATMIATRGADWAQTLCTQCYLILANKQREKINDARRAKAKEEKRKNRRSGPTRQERQNGVEPSHRRGSAPQLISIEERKELEQRLPGIDYLLAFFRTAGVRTDLIRGGSLRINGHHTLPLAGILPAPGKLDWDNVINAMAVSYASDIFIAAMTDNTRFDEGLRAFLRRSERGFAIMRDDAQLATIHATRAEIPHRDVIRANFLTPGPHWQLVADIVHSAEPELLTEWSREQDAKMAAAAAEVAAETERRRMAAAAAAARSGAAARRRIDHLPEDLSPELIAASLRASRRIRLERQVAYDRPVTLQCSLGDLMLLPITGNESRLLMPFRLSTGTEALTGELLLENRDPIPLLIREDISDDDAITAWTCALLGFADATCIEIEPDKPVHQHPPTGVRPRNTNAPSHSHPVTPPLPRARRWPEHLEPVGHWIRYSGSFVAGHRRRLSEGQCASADAIDRARQVGITLDHNETWVKAHTRGIPDGVEMRFRWRTPIPLTRSRRGTSV